MKYCFTILTLLSVSGISAQKKYVADQKLITTIKEFHQALVQANVTSINQQTDKALSYGHSNGWVETKAELLQNLETKLITYSSYKEDSISTTIHGNTANVRFNAAIAATMNGKEETFYLKVLEVWNKKGNRWVLFARQSVKNRFIN
jgi:hypothetical protein